MRKDLLILSIAVILSAAPAAAQVDVRNLPMPDRYVEDYANVVNPEHEQALLGILQELEQKTGVQYIILTVDSTVGTPIEEFSIEYAHNKWKLGQADKDNGLLFVLAVEDRAYRFEVGYGLEGVITDRFAGQVGREVLVPYLRKGDYSLGIYQANLRLIQRIAGGAGVTLTGMPDLPSQPLARGPGAGRSNALLSYLCSCCSSLFLFLLFVLLVGGVARGGGLGWSWLLLPFLFRTPRHYGRYGSGGPFGGGFGGFGGGMRGGFGGFGGFGGGGGGGFGGGGASGGW